jgi:hypothetical protein
LADSGQDLAGQHQPVLAVGVLAQVGQPGMKLPQQRTDAGIDLDACQT